MKKKLLVVCSIMLAALSVFPVMGNFSVAAEELSGRIIFYNSVPEHEKIDDMEELQDAVASMQKYTLSEPLYVTVCLKHTEANIREMTQEERKEYYDNLYEKNKSLFDDMGYMRIDPIGWSTFLTMDIPQENLNADVLAAVANNPAVGYIVISEQIGLPSTTDEEKSKIGFCTSSTGRIVCPGDDEELEEMFVNLVDDATVLGKGIYVSIIDKKGETKREVYPCEELTLVYLQQLAMVETIAYIEVGHAELPVEPGGSQTGDSAVYAVITLCTAAAALTVLASRRKKII